MYRPRLRTASCSHKNARCAAIQLPKSAPSAASFVTPTPHHENFINGWLKSNASALNSPRTRRRLLLWLSNPTPANSSNPPGQERSIQSGDVEKMYDLPNTLARLAPRLGPRSIAADFPEVAWDLSRLNLQPSNSPTQFKYETDSVPHTIDIPAPTLSPTLWNKVERLIRRLSLKRRKRGGVEEPSSPDIESKAYDLTLKSLPIKPGVLKPFDGSLALLLLTARPDHPWQPWRFSHTPHGWWANLKLLFHQRDPVAVVALADYLEFTAKGSGLTMAQLLGFEVLEYAINTNVSKHRLAGLPWKEVKGAILGLPTTGASPAPADRPVGDWASLDSQRQYLSDLANQLASRNPKKHPDHPLSPLYDLTTLDVFQTGGKSLLGLYGGSISGLLAGAFPTHDWKHWRFRLAPKQFWNKLAHQFNYNKDPASTRLVSDYVKHLERSAGLESPQDWAGVAVTSRLKPRDVMNVKKLGGFVKVLHRVYPELPVKGLEQAYGTRRKLTPKRLIKQTRISSVAQNLL